MIDDLIETIADACSDAIAALFGLAGQGIARLWRRLTGR